MKSLATLLVVTIALAGPAKAGNVDGPAKAGRVDSPAKAGHYEDRHDDQHPAAVPHWPEGANVLVWIDSNRAPAGAAALVQKAMTTWTMVSGGRLTLARAARREDAAIRVFFVRSDSVFGEAAPRLDPATGLIRSAEIALNAGVPGATSDPSDIDARIVVYLTALHELGHALGLPHSDKFSSIMYRFRRPDDGERFFGAYRAKLRGVDDIGTSRATGLDHEDVDNLKLLYVGR